MPILSVDVRVETSGHNAIDRVGDASVGKIAGWGTLHRQNHSTACDYSNAIVRSRTKTLEVEMSPARDSNSVTPLDLLD